MESNIFDTILSIFDSLFHSIEERAFNIGAGIVLGVLTPILTLIIIFWAGKKIKEAEFNIPKDIFQIIIFLLLISFVNYSISNYSFFQKYVIEILDIPANYIQQFVFGLISNNLDSNTYTLGTELQNGLNNVFNNTILYAIPSNVGFFGLLNPTILLNLILWGVYAFFGLILFVSMAITIILTYLQIAFWKSFAIIMLPLLYFKVTRAMVFFWIKTIIALSLIQILVLIVGGLDNLVENNIANTLNLQTQNTKASLMLVTAFIITKLISISLLKEIPAMINGMFGTQASSNTGAFANSTAMKSVGIMGAVGAFGAIRSSLGLGRVMGNTAQGLGKTALESNTGGAVVSGINNIASGIANSSFGSKSIEIASGIKRGVSNVTTGKSWNTNKPN